MKSPRSLVAALLALSGYLTAPAQMPTLTWHLTDAGGAAVAHGVGTLTPTLCSATPASLPSASGVQVTQAAIPVQVVGGVLGRMVANVFTPGVPVVDVLAAPIHFCYALVLRDQLNDNALLVKTGYDKLQPGAGASWCTTANGATTCSLESYTPNLAAVLPVVAGPAGATGAQGPAGPAGPAGAGVADGSLNASTYTGSGDPVAALMTAPGQVINVGPAIAAPTTYLPTFDGTVLHYTTPGYEGNRYRNCPYNQASYSAGLLDLNACGWDHVTFTGQSNAPTAHQALRFSSMYSYGPGANYSSNWRITDLLNTKIVVANRGITDAHERVTEKRAEGDLTVQDDYTWVDGGFNKQSDEGVVGHRNYVNQNLEYWQGTSQSAATINPATGNSTVTVPLLSDSNTTPTNRQKDSNHTIDGGYLVNVTPTYQIAGTITGPGSQLAGSGYLNTLPSSVALPINTAWGIIPGTIPNFHAPATNTPYTVTVTLKAGSFVLGKPVRIAGPNYPEMAAPVISVQPPSGGTQQITIAVRNPQLTAGANIFQGGMGGRCLSVDAEVKHEPILNQLYGRTSYPVFGSMDGTNLIYGFFPQGTSSTLPSPDAQLFNPGVTGVNGFHLHPCAEVVANLSLQHDPQLEPNDMPLAVGDQLEAPLPPAVFVQANKSTCGMTMAPNGTPSVCSEITIGGDGATSNVSGLKINNAQSYSFYSGNSRVPPLALWITGHFNEGIRFDNWPKSAAINMRNMGLDGTTTGEVVAFPHGQVYWDDLGRVLSSDGLGSTTYQGPAAALTGACVATQYGRWSFGRNGTSTWCNPATSQWEGPRIQPPAVTPASGAATFACFDSGGQLYSSATACNAAAVTAPTPPPTTAGTYGGMTVGRNGNLNGFQPFAGSSWTQLVTTAAVDSTTAAWVAENGTIGLHPDFDNSIYGIPYNVVDSSVTAQASVAELEYPAESDLVTAPIPSSVAIESSPANCDTSGNDNHMLLLDKATGFEYEWYHFRPCNGAFNAGNSAVWDLAKNNDLNRPWGMTSVDAAGLSVLAGLAKYEEATTQTVPAQLNGITVQTLGHALRFTMQNIGCDHYAFGDGYAAIVPPATHGSCTNSGTKSREAMTVRLVPGYNCSGLTGPARIICNTLQTYGMKLGDLGSSGYISGTNDSRWDPNNLQFLSGIKLSQFEIIAIPQVYSQGGSSTSIAFPVGNAPTNTTPVATPSTIATGHCSTLTWTSSGATHEFLQNGHPSRTQSSIECPTATTTYVLNSDNQYGRTASGSVTVTVTP